MGRILWVDLTTGKSTVETPDPSVYRKWMGGYGLGVHYIYQRTARGCDPLGPGNVLGFCPGLFTGSPAPITGRCFVCGKSPQTLTWNDSSVGGFLGMAIKRAGFDAVFVTGSAPKPVYLYIESEKHEIIDAGVLWGKDTKETESYLKERHEKNVHSCSIGPAGERKVLFAGIACDGGRMAARGGMGAVMGAKHLKALCFGGSGKAKLHDQEATRALAKKYNARINMSQSNIGAKMATSMARGIGDFARIFKIPLAQSHAIAVQVFKHFGTAFALNVQIAVGDTPIQNFKGVGYTDFPLKVAEKFTTEGMEKWITGNQGCFSCPIQCGHVMKVPELDIQDTHRPEYETLASFGPLLLNEDVLTVIRLNEYCNRAGLDTISAGVTVAFVIECCEKGMLSAKDLECDAYPGGFLPGWNKPECIMPLLELVVKREGIGDLIANGVAEMAKIIGKGSEEHAMVVNRQEIPMHDPRKFEGLLTTYIADPTPGRHTAASLDFQALGDLNNFVHGLKFDLSKKGRVSGTQHARFTKFMQVFNAVGLCEFALNFERYPLLEFFKSILGWDVTLDEMEQTGHRIQAMRQMFNARDGMIHFSIPDRARGVPPLSKGPLARVTFNPRKNIVEYFTAMGFSEEGVPRKETLEALGLDDCIKDLQKARGDPVPPFG